MFVNKEYELSKKTKHHLCIIRECEQMFYFYLLITASYMV